MLPYANSLYFSFLLYPAVIAIVLGLLGRLSWRWVLGLNLAVLVVQYSVNVDNHLVESIPKIRILAVYGSFQLALAHLFLRSRRRRNSRIVFRAAVVAGLLPLVMVKFLLTDAGRAYVGFLGISYVTFRALDVLICIQDGLISQLRSGRYLTYLLFFPTISAGPIDRYRRFLADGAQPRTGGEYLLDVNDAVQHIFRGLLYKFLLATLIKEYWLDPVSATGGIGGVAAYMYAYTFYLFFDFAGYSAFAIGVGCLLGIRTPENFNRPFAATNIVDFWNRWHISLSTWFRDHVYMRFIMAAMRGRWFRNKLTMSCVGFYLSFGLMGVWHGSAPRYIIYGLYHATLLSTHTILTGRRKRLPVSPPSRFSNLAMWFVTFHLIAFGLLVFSGRLG